MASMVPSERIVAAAISHLRTAGITVEKELYSNASRDKALYSILLAQELLGLIVTPEMMAAMKAHPRPAGMAAPTEPPARPVHPDDL